MFGLSFFTLAALAALASSALARVQYLGVAIAGGDFGCLITGDCPTGSTQLPLSSLGGGDGLGQMWHFVQDDQMNIFRLPISWQFLGANKIDGSLDAGNLAKYDQVVQACLGTGALCMIELHNFARVNGAIIGQGGPTDEQFASLWAALAGKYAASGRVVFELMNEPHDLDVNLWAATCQKAVTAIRGAGAASQMILLPGSNFDSAATLVSGGAGGADALLAVTNPDGGTAGLLLDVHKYLDVDNSGTHAACVTDNVDAFGAVAAYLRARGRQGFVSETGAAPGSASCLTDFCAQNSFINANADVFVGLVAWAAGSFSPSYLLSLTPSKSGNGFVDNALMKQCVLGTWANSTSSAPPPPPPPSSSTNTAGPSGASAPSVGSGTSTVVTGGGGETTTTVTATAGTGAAPSSSSSRTASGSTTTRTVGNATATTQTPTSATKNAAAAAAAALGEWATAMSGAAWFLMAIFM